MTNATTQNLTFSAAVELTAADAPNKQPSVLIEAYSGGIMSPPGWGDVSVDLSRLEITAQLPLLADHQNSLNGVVGHGVPSVKGGKLYVEGKLSAASEAGKTILQLHRDGVHLQASLGMTPTKQTFYEHGKTVTVNGRTLTAGERGLIVVEAGRLREVSIVALGADSETSVSIAAQKGQTMTTQNPGQDLEAIRLEERQRFQNDVRQLEANLKVCERMDGGSQLAASIRDDFYEGKITLDAVNDRLLHAIQAERPKPVFNTGYRPEGHDQKVIEAALALRINSATAEKAYDERTLEAAGQTSVTCLMDVAKMCAHMSGQPYNARNKDSVLQAAFSTTTYSTILSNVANKSAQMAYRSFPSIISMIAKTLDAKNFKEHTGVRLTGDFVHEQIGKTGEIKHGDLGDDSYTYSIGTYAKMFGISRQEIIDDDAGALNEVPSGLGRGAALSLNEVFWALVLANTNNFFSVANGNLITDPLASAGLAALVQKFYEQTDTRDKPIGVIPKHLVLPPALKKTGDELYVSTMVHAGGADASTDSRAPSGNVYQGQYRTQVSPWIGANGLDGGSDEGYYLFGNPNDVAAFGVAYLDGRSEPMIEQEPQPFNVLGVQWRSVFDFGVCQIDHRGAAYSVGDGSSS